MHIRWFIILSLIFLILFSILIINYKNTEIKFKNLISLKRHKKCVMTSYLEFSSIRNKYFDIKNMQDTSSSINENIFEAFNIFLKVSPSVISTLTKADKRLLVFKSLLNDNYNYDLLNKELQNIDELLNKLIEVSHEMIERLEEILSKPVETVSTIELSTTSVSAYTESVNLLTELVENHSVVNYEIHYILSKKYPELIDEFRIVSGKITYILFILLISYSNKIDENMYLYF